VLLFAARTDFINIFNRYEEWYRYGQITERITKGSSPEMAGYQADMWKIQVCLFVTSENVGKNDTLPVDKKKVCRLKSSISKFISAV
jgi:hypothetical protein